MINQAALLIAISPQLLPGDGITIHFWREPTGLWFNMQFTVGFIIFFFSLCFLVLPSKSLFTQTTEYPLKAEMKIAATQTAAVVVGLPGPEVFFMKIKLRLEKAQCSQCKEWSSHWWHYTIRALEPEECTVNYMYVLRIPLV